MTDFSTLQYGSVCSGIEAASVAWEPIGWQPAWFSEIDAFPSAVLEHHWPDVANHGDMTQLPNLIRTGTIVAPDILVGGTPCQAFSVAGRRQSLDDARGNLTLAFIDIAEAIDERRKSNEEEPTIIVWENVPGVLNTKDNAFGCFLAGLSGEKEPLQPPGKRWANAGYIHGPIRQIAWRVLDAKYFGVPQRRRRVFVVASAGCIDPSKILFESESLRRDIEESREERKNVATYAESGFAEYRESDVAGTLKREGGCLSGGSETLVIHGTQDPCVSKEEFALGRNNGAENVIVINANIIGKTENSGGNGLGVKSDGTSYTLTANDKHVVAYGLDKQVFSIIADTTPKITTGQSGTLRANGGRGIVPPSVAYENIVRKLTPVECERLQGFPDDHTRIPWRGKDAKDCPDGPRYKAIGNSMAVPVMAWIGDRIIQYWRVKNGRN